MASSCNAPTLLPAGSVPPPQRPLAGPWHAASNGVGPMTRSDAIVRRQLLKAGLIIAGAPFCPEALFAGRAAANDEKPAEDTPIGRREIVKGLDGMSRVAEKGNTFAGGHNAAAVISSAFFCREQKLDADTHKEILAYLD